MLSLVGKSKDAKWVGCNYLRKPKRKERLFIIHHFEQFDKIFSENLSILWENLSAPDFSLMKNL